MAKSLEKFGGVPAGGTTGQALVKTSGTDNDVEWGTVSGGGSSLNARRLNPVRVLCTTNQDITDTSTYDGVGLTDNDRVALSGQTDPEENGVWQWSESTEDLSRPADFNTGSGIVSGCDFFVMDGTHAGELWRVTGTADVVTDALTLEQFSPGGGGSVTFDAIGDAAAPGTIDNTSHLQTINWSSVATGEPPLEGYFLKLQLASADLFCLRYVIGNSYCVEIGASGSGRTSLLSPAVYVGISGGAIGFFGGTPAAKQTAFKSTMSVTDGAFAALSFSDPPTQSECQALRDLCESLADDLRNVESATNGLNDALKAYELINNSI